MASRADQAFEVPLWRALAVYRIAALAYATLLVTLNFRTYAHPVVAWVAFDGARYLAGQRLQTYLAWDGHRVPFGRGYEHAVTIAGADDGAVLVNNPRWGYRQWLPRDAFLAAFATFANMAVVLGS